MCSFYNKWHNVHATNMCYNMRYSQHLGIVDDIFITRYVSENAHIKIYFAQNS